MKRFAMVLGLLSGFAGTSAFAGGKAVQGHDELAPQVSLDELKKLVETKGALIVDANGTEMYNAGHIPGAISFAQHEGKLMSVLPKDKNALIVAYCGGTMCSAWEAAAKEAKQQGYTNIKHFKGGIKGWKEAKMQVETGAGKPS